MLQTRSRTAMSDMLYRPNMGDGNSVADVQGGRDLPLEDSTTDKIVDGAGDASVGTCGTGTGGRNGSNGYDSHTYIYSNGKGRSVPDWDTRKGTEDGDSLSRNPPALWDETLICNQFIGDRIYGVTKFRDTFRDI